MNRENIQKVRDVIAALDPTLFNMDTTGEGCGTPACIAGWAVRAIDGHARVGGCMVRATELLGLERTTESGMCDLFSPAAARAGTHQMRQTPAQAVAVLDHLLATGEVDWSVAEQVMA